VTFSGRAFHHRAAATGKAPSPIVERRVRGTTSDDVDAERSLGTWGLAISFGSCQPGNRPEYMHVEGCYAASSGAKG